MNPKIARKPEIKILKHIQSDISILKQKILSMEIEISEIGNDLHRELNPEFVKKLRTIQGQKGIRFSSMKEFDESFSK